MLSSISTVFVRPSRCNDGDHSVIHFKPALIRAVYVLEADFLTHASFLQLSPRVDHMLAFPTCG
jgi:hypothetical protein